MSQTMSANWRQCAVCEYWGGRRTATTFRDQATYDGLQAKGECLGGGFNRMQVTATQTCPKWKKWGVLK